MSIVHKATIQYSTEQNSAEQDIPPSPMQSITVTLADWLTHPHGAEATKRLRELTGPVHRDEEGGLAVPPRCVHVSVQAVQPLGAAGHQGGRPRVQTQRVRDELLGEMRGGQQRT